ncbi:MAG TPA: MBL fold metallo-hydrolase [Desulfatiglandales bacterium]|nr:MBL fold metallo-hydrolase [Desulfatiglandales bacterium]
MNSACEVKPTVTFWGTRGSISTPGRITEKYGGNTPCVTIRYKDICIILDAGTGIRNLGVELLEEFKNIENHLTLHLFLSHTHWDHIQGFPFFQPAYHENTKIIIYGSPNKERFLASILKHQMDSEYFPVGMSAFLADINIQEMSEEAINLGEGVIDWQEQHYHPGGSVRYRFRVNGKKIVYATDVELNRMFRPSENNAENKDLAQDYLDFICNADLLIADGQYTEKEYENKAGWGHSSIGLLLDIACKAQVKQLAVFHHDPQHSDTFLDELWISNRPGYNHSCKDMDFFWAREGMTLEI